MYVTLYCLQWLKCKIRGGGLGERYIQVRAPDNGHVPFPSIITIWGGGNALSNKLEVGERRSLASHYTLTTEKGALLQYGVFRLFPKIKFWSLKSVHFLAFQNGETVIWFWHTARRHDRQFVDKNSNFFSNHFIIKDSYHEVYVRQKSIVTLTTLQNNKNKTTFKNKTR